MKVQYVNIPMKRRDGRKGPPTAVTDGKIYEVVDVYPEEGMYRIINDKGKRSRYDKQRFIIVEQ